MIRVRHVEGLEGEKEPEFDEEGREIPPPPPPEFLTKEDFRGLFVSLHDLPTMVDPDMGVFSIPAPTGNPIADLRYEGACQVADRFYDRAALDGAPEWLKSFIRSDQKALMSWGAMAVYGFGMVNAGRQFKAIKQARAMEAQAPANEDAAPTFQSVREDAA